MLPHTCKMGTSAAARSPSFFRTSGLTPSGLAVVAKCWKDNSLLLARQNEPERPRYQGVYQTENCDTMHNPFRTKFISELSGKLDSEVSWKAGAFAVSSRNCWHTGRRTCRSRSRLLRSIHQMLFAINLEGPVPALFLMPAMVVGPATLIRRDIASKQVGSTVKQFQWVKVEVHCGAIRVTRFSIQRLGRHTLPEFSNTKTNADFL
jgi:hypothetical protein